MRPTKGEEYNTIINICEQVDNMCEQINTFCKLKYGHTDWVFTDDLSEQELKEIETKKLGNIIPSIVFYYNKYNKGDYNET